MAEELRDIIDSAEEAARRSGQGSDTVRGAVAGGIDESLEEDAVPLAKSLAPEGDTGHLKRSIDSEGGEWRGPTYSAYIGARASYAAVQEYGTRKKNYPIAAKNGEFMKFYWEKKGRTVYRRVVTHPGIKGKYFLRDGVMETSKARKRRVLENLGDTFEGAYGKQ